MTHHKFDYFSSQLENHFTQEKKVENSEALQFNTAKVSSPTNKRENNEWNVFVSFQLGKV